MKKLYFILIVSVLTLALTAILIVIKWNALGIILIDKNLLGDSNAQQTSASYGDNSQDADGVLWGTEAYATIMEEPNGQKEIDAINNTLKVKNIKVRVEWASEKNPSNIVCMGPNCLRKYDLDKFAQIFKTNNWSMRPMFSLKSQGDKPYSDSDIDDYVNYIDWFVSKYKKDTSIKYIELINTPLVLLANNPANPSAGNLITLKQLLNAQNKVYDRIKGKFPDVMVGSHGFEYMMDDEGALQNSAVPAADIAKEMVEYFLDKNNGAKFDYWAFHGYATYPSPVQIPTKNKYSGVSGILEIRKKMDSNGWQNRLIVDTEHVFSFGPTFSDIEDKIGAVATLQELVVKRTLKQNDAFVLSGITPLKIISKELTGEHEWGSLKDDSSLSQTVSAVSLLWSKLNKYKYDSRISGELGQPGKAWVEKFKSGDNAELYIFFKSFNASDSKGSSPSSFLKTLMDQLDKETLNYKLRLNKKPSTINLITINGNKINLTPSQTITLDVVNSPKFLEITY